MNVQMARSTIKAESVASGPATPRPRGFRAVRERTGMKQIELSAGTIEYDDTGGSGPVLVLVHGMMMGASLWDGLIAELSADHRCLAPTLPLGAHRHPVHVRILRPPPPWRPVPPGSRSPQPTSRSPNGD
jgi:hypothetical protein